MSKLFIIKLRQIKLPCGYYFQFAHQSFPFQESDHEPEERGRCTSIEQDMHKKMNIEDNIVHDTNYNTDIYTYYVHFQRARYHNDQKYNTLQKHYAEMHNLLKYYAEIRNVEECRNTKMQKLCRNAKIQKRCAKYKTL